METERVQRLVTLLVSIFEEHNGDRHFFLYTPVRDHWDRKAIRSLVVRRIPRWQRPDLTRITDDEIIKAWPQVQTYLVLTGQTLFVRRRMAPFDSIVVRQELLEYRPRGKGSVRSP